MNRAIRNFDNVIHAGAGRRGAVVPATAFAVALLFASTPAAAQNKCEAGKNQASGKYAACAANAEKGLVLKGDTDKHADALVKCAAKLGSGFDKLEAKFNDCPTTADAGDIEGFLDFCTQAVAQALEDGTPLPDEMCATDLATCEGSLVTCDGDLTSCDGELTTCGGELTTCQDDLEACEASPGGGVARTGQTAVFGAGSDGVLQLGVVRSFTDNGDGTITDNVTGLMWEKKSDDGSIHDKDDLYTWSAGAPWDMNGTMVTTFLAALNSSGGFAGYTDWRIPNVNELQTLVNFGGTANPSAFAEFNDNCTASCTVTTCSCTRSEIHESSTTLEASPNSAWGVSFFIGGTNYTSKTGSRSVRAVRAGS